jgi:hypothetical protein
MASGETVTQTVVNGYGVEDLRLYVEAVMRDSGKAERNTSLTAFWLGKNRARVELKNKLCTWVATMSSARCNCCTHRSRRV